MNDNKLEKYQVSATDWRASLRSNQRNTFIVIILFVLIYVALGFVIDLYLGTAQNIPLEYTLENLLNFKTLPMATLIMLLVAVISVMITFLFYDNLMMLGTEYHEVTSDSQDSIEGQQLYNVVDEMKIAAGLRFMPKIYIIDADYMNAFASGYSEKSAMVAITRGLLQKLDRNELQAVMAHELSHIRHGDVRLSLTVALLSNLILIVIDLLFRGVLYSRGRKDGRLVFVIMLARFLLPIITILLMLYLSRKRELMADAGCVELMRANEPLARALIKIHEDTLQHQETYKEEYEKTAHEEVRQASYLYDPKYAGISPLKSLNSLFSTHPSLEDRLKALGIEKRI